MSHIYDDTLCLMVGKRISEQETKQRMLDIASELLVVSGPTVGLDVIRMEKVITAAKVSRASAYRAWPSKADFLSDALVTALGQVTMLPEGLAEIKQLKTLIESHSNHWDTAEGRRSFVVNALRISVDADIRRMLASPHWRLFVGISANFPGLEDEDLKADVAAELARIQQSFVTRRARIYQQLCTLIGYRQRAPWVGPAGFRALSELAGLTMNGILNRGLSDPGWLDQRTELALFDAPAALWSQAEIAMLTVLLGHLEPDPAVEWNEARYAESLAWFEEFSKELVRDSGEAQSYHGMMR